MRDREDYWRMEGVCIAESGKSCGDDSMTVMMTDHRHARPRRVTVTLKLNDVEYLSQAFHKFIREQQARVDRTRKAMKGE